MRIRGDLFLQGSEFEDGVSWALSSAVRRWEPASSQ